MDSIFIEKNFTSHAGLDLDFKIECDNLTDEDVKTLAKIISEKYMFFNVIGIPTGGTRLADELKKYSNKESNVLLIVDDVLTTGKSMQNERKKLDYSMIVNDLIIKGVVIFARNNCPDWIEPIFQMWNLEKQNNL
jgi:hypothetical protein